jgi:hypothetical protein
MFFMVLHSAILFILSVITDTHSIAEVDTTGQDYRRMSQGTIDVLLGSAAGIYRTAAS